MTRRERGLSERLGCGNGGGRLDFAYDLENVRSALSYLFVSTDCHFIRVWYHFGTVLLDRSYFDLILWSQRQRVEMTALADATACSTRPLTARRSLDPVLFDFVDV